MLITLPVFLDKMLTFLFYNGTDGSSFNFSVNEGKYPNILQQAI